MITEMPRKAPPADAPGPAAPLGLRLFWMMQLIRRTEEILIAEYHPADQMRCPIHFCNGQEATPAALSILLRSSDVVLSHHRSHGYYLAKGAPLDALVAEFYGKATGANGGLAGSQELSHDDSRFFSGTILSGMFAIAAGDALAARYNRDGHITVAVIGDGGMEEGIVFETLNFAARFALPVLFICENNQYSAHTRIDRRSLSNTIHGRAAAFGVKSMLLDGNDALLLHHHIGGILNDLRDGAGPWFLEVETYRTCGHVGPEDDDFLGYRPREELLKWKQRDPVQLLRDVLVQQGTDPAELDRLTQSIDDRVHRAVRLAKEAPFPSYEEALSFNASGTYASVVKSLNETPMGVFDPQQMETRLKPY